MHHGSWSKTLIAESIPRHADSKLGFSFSADFVEVPKSTEQMEAVLAKHVIECRHCLAMALFRTEDLSQTGCDEYIDLLAEMRFLLKLEAEMNEEAHIEESVLEEYCFGRLPKAEARQLEEHLAACSACVASLEDCRNFIALMKGALAQVPVRQGA